MQNIRLTPDNLLIGPGELVHSHRFPIFFKVVSQIKGGIFYRMPQNKGMERKICLKDITIFFGMVSQIKEGKKGNIFQA